MRWLYWGDCLGTAPSRIRRIRERGQWRLPDQWKVDYVMGQAQVGNPDQPLPAEDATFLELGQPEVMLTDWNLGKTAAATYCVVKGLRIVPSRQP
jgi:hypothetical protein